MMNLRKWIDEKLFRRGGSEDVQRRKTLRRIEKLRGRVAKARRIEHVAKQRGREYTRLLLKYRGWRKRRRKLAQASRRRNQKHKLSLAKRKEKRAKAGVRR